MTRNSPQKQIRTPEMSAEVEAFLRDSNPWWESRSGAPVPVFRRWVFDRLIRNLKGGLAPGVVLKGPRQVGKTTLQNQVIEYFLKEERIDPRRIFRIQFDEIPSLGARRFQDLILSLCRWYEDKILGRSFNEAAHEGKPAYLFFDEIQNLSSWAPQLKSLVDHHSVHVMITGSSALRIRAGHDSLAGRVSSIELGPLLLREIAGLRFQETIPSLLPHNSFGSLKQAEFWENLKQLGWEQRELRDRAFAAYSERGAYPFAQDPAAPSWEAVMEHLNETVIQRALIHDLGAGRKRGDGELLLLEEILNLACRYAGQTPGQAILVQEARFALGAEIGWQQIRNELRRLDNTLLIKLIAPLELRIKRRKGYDKICLCDPALRAAWLDEKVPLTPDGLRQFPDLGDLAGHLAESVAGYFLGSLPGIGVHHFPAREIEPEVDFVLTIGEKRIPVEIKYQNQVRDEDTYGLRAFLEKTVYHATFGILVTRTDDVKIRDPRIIALPLSSLLLLR